MTIFEPSEDDQHTDSMFDNWHFSPSKEVKLWRRICWILAFILFLAVAGLIIQSKQPPVVYVVEVSDTGQVRNVGKAAYIEYQPQIETIKYFLSSFVKNIRAIPTDPIVLKESILNAYNFVTVKGKAVLNSYAREYDPFKKMKQNIAISVTVSSIIIRSDSVYQVEWYEERYDNGIKTSTERYVGLFTIIIQKPKTEDIIRANPLGIWVNFFNISKELQ
jgi:type IV secretion system protein TrbF